MAGEPCLNEILCDDKKAGAALQEIREEAELKLAKIMGVCSMKSSQTHELMECRKAAIRAIDEHRQNMIQALDTLLEASEGRTGKWSFVQTLFLHLRVNPLDFKVAIKDATIPDC
jgi:hypothetical protein